VLILKILVLSDVHSNKYALDTILKHARKIDYTIFLGDAVDYGPHPAEVIDILRENVDIWIMGNHDNAVAFNVDCKCGQELHDLSVYTRENITLKLISDDQKKFLQNLPIRKEIEIEGKTFYLVHGSPRDPLYGYVFPEVDEQALLKNMFMKTIAGETRVSADFVLLGHTHKPMIRRIGETKILNPGSVGQPRDGDPRASFAIIDLDANSSEIIRLTYPVDKLIQDLDTYSELLNIEKKVLEKLKSIFKTGRIH